MSIDALTVHIPSLTIEDIEPLIDQEGFAVIPLHWVVEQMFAGLDVIDASAKTMNTIPNVDDPE